ncbi:MAG: HAD-IA family hydrolase [Oscillatoriales cyanobacterium SM2_1_8]|nr:HAD-IA family hydrolase [Oscillatoriales cyanobacterium SM2_1_8]
MPKAIFFDAVGTLFGVRGSVGAVYAQIAAEFAVTAAPDRLQQAFFRAFGAASPMAFPGCPPAEVATQENRWWRAIAETTFAEAGVLADFADFEEFWARLYGHFATADPWEVYPDTHPVLARWRRQGVTLGIISNFDSRLQPVLAALDLAPYFDTVVYSTAVGAAKPDPRIFAAALGDWPASECWHVGDSYQADVVGATAAGLQAFWLDRGAIAPAPFQVCGMSPNQPTFSKS